MLSKLFEQKRDAHLKKTVSKTRKSYEKYVKVTFFAQFDVEHESIKII